MDNHWIGHSFLGSDPATTIEHVEHRVAMWWTPVAGEIEDDRLWRTKCGVRFVPGGTKRDAEVHEPALLKCVPCYG